MGKEWLCDACDWIGSPSEEPAECPNCGEIDTLTVIGDDGEDDTST